MDDAKPNQAPHMLPSMAEVEVPGMISRRAARVPPRMPTALPAIAAAKTAWTLCCSYSTMSS